MNYIENNYKDIDDFINAIDEKYNKKKRNNYDDESISHSDGRNSHINYNILDVK